eukprot:COSAG02_NODE_34636_length_481_cov_0.630890_2_plen_35_part_01
MIAIEIFPFHGSLERFNPENHFAVLENSDGAVGLA